MARTFNGANSQLFGRLSLRVSDHFISIAAPQAEVGSQDQQGHGIMFLLTLPACFLAMPNTFQLLRPG